MSTRIQSRRILTPDGVRAGYVYLDGGRIADVTDAARPCDTMVDVGDDYVSPGFIDLHVHGGAGHDFAGTVDDVIAGVQFHLSHGTTSICPTVSAAPFPVMAQAAARIGCAKRSGRARANILGAHLEGPYLSRAQCGAQSPDFITPPNPADYEPLIAAHGADIARWTFAPEHDDGTFCRYLASHGILPSAGHTDATGAELNRAVDAGCRLVTHLYSCCSTVTRDHGFRRLGVIEQTFLRDDVYAEIIADGCHLPPDLIRLILKVMGKSRVALVTDALSLAGTDAKSGRMMATDYIIEDGVCKLTDRSAFAGSIATTDRLVRVMRDEVGVPLRDAVAMAADVPAQIMGLRKGRLAAGYDADVIVFDDDVRVSAAWVRGERAI